MRNDRRRPARPRPGKPEKTASKKPASRTAPAKKATAKRPDAGKQPHVVTDEPRTLRLGVVPGMTPGRWIDTWNQRMTHVALELVPLESAGQREGIDDVDVALVRLPLARADDLHVIPLYDEVSVVVCAKDSHLMAVDELTPDDLTGEVLITPGDDVLGPLGLPTVAPDFAAVATTADAIATVASGAGIVVVPMSVARLHTRKDADYRPLLDGPTSTVALAWRRDATTPDVEAFVGIVRGRTANSSR